MSVPVAERVVKLGTDGRVLNPVLPFIRNVIRVEVDVGDGSDIRRLEFDNPEQKPIECINISDDDDDLIANDKRNVRKGEKKLFCKLTVFLEVRVLIKIITFNFV